MLKYFLLLLFIVSSVSLSAFEGNVQLTLQSRYDTTYFIFYIKDTKVRMDEFNNGGQLVKTLLIDLNTENIVAVNPSLKLYVDVPKKENFSKAGQQMNVIKTNNFKLIEGKTCYQWRVRNRILETEITYWVMESEIGAVQKLFKILSSAENYTSLLSFFLYIPDNEGFIPMMAVERNLVREQKQSMQITSINERKLPARLFQIPVDYKSAKI